MNFEVFISEFINNAYSFLKKTLKLEKNHDFQLWFNDIIIVIQIINCIFIIKSDTSLEETHVTRFIIVN